MADLDTRIILAGRGIDPVAAFDRGTIAGQNALAARQNVDVSNLYRAQGANILAGDQNALNALAQISPEAAFNARINRQTVDTNAFNLEAAKVKAARETENYMAGLGAAQAAQEAAELRSMAEAAALANNPEQWAQTFAGTPYEAAWDQRAAVLEILGTQKSVVDRMFPAAPEPQDEYGRYAAEEAAAGRQPLSRIDYAKAKSPSLTVETLPDGTQRVTQGVGAPPKMTEAEGRNTGFLYRMEESNKTLTELEAQGTSLYNKTAGSLPVVGNFLVEADYQKFDQAKRDFINAILRRESGAVIADSEFANAERQYFPQPGDSAEVIAQKRRNREIAIDGVRAGSGPGAATAPTPEQPKAATGIPPVPQDVDPDLWPQIWEAMPEKDRALFQ